MYSDGGFKCLEYQNVTHPRSDAISCMIENFNGLQYVPRKIYAYNHPFDLQKLPKNFQCISRKLNWRDIKL